MQGYQGDSCASNQDGQLVQTPIAQQPPQENASNLQDDIPVVNQAPDTTSVVPSQNGL